MCFSTESLHFLPPPKKHAGYFISDPTVCVNDYVYVMPL